MNPFRMPRLISAVAGVCLCATPAARAAVDIVTSTADSGPGSLRDTMAAANAGDIIIFSSSLAGQTISLTSGELSIGLNLTIDASGLTGGMVIDGGANSRLMEIGGGSSVNLKTLTLSNGSVGDSAGGGAILVDTACTLNASNCAYLGNNVNTVGGAIEADGATVTLSGCMFSNNEAPEGGGAIDENGNTVTVNGCTFLANGTGFQAPGGAIEISFGKFAATNCTILDSSSFLGGAFDNADTATLDHCIISSNEISSIIGLFFPSDGGGICNHGQLVLNNCTVSGNSNLGGYGGGIYNDGGIVLSNCTVSGNLGGSGGGIMNSNVLTASDCTFSGNSAGDGGYGGGIDNGSQMILKNCTLADNSASDGFGGGLYTFSATNVLVNCTVCSNSASSGYGGGIYNDAGSLALTNTIAAGNLAGNSSDVYGPYSGLANFIGGNPRLASLGSYGGATPTMPPQFGSPVIDAGMDWVTSFLATDQRGFHRLAGAHVDIGAAEAQIAPATKRPILGHIAWSPMPASFQFSFTNVASSDFTVLGSTNLTLPFAQWTILGNVPQGSPGQFQFSGGAGSNPAQFYHVVSP